MANPNIVATDEEGNELTDSNVEVNGIVPGSGGGSGKPYATVVVAASDAKSTTGADFVSDGTDDHTTINNAISALPSGGGRVVLTEGTYDIGNSVTDQELTNVWLQGQGWGTRLILQGSTAENVIDFSGVTQATIRDLAIDGNAANQSDIGKDTQCGVFVSDFNEVTVDGCYIHDTGYANVRAKAGAGADNIRIQNNRCDRTEFNTETASDNISTTSSGGASTYIDRQIITNNICLNAATHGIEIADGTRYVRLAGNLVEGHARVSSSPAAGLNPHSGSNDESSYQAIIGNTVNGGADGIRASVSDSTILGNVVNAPGTVGIVLTDFGGGTPGHNNTFVGNVVRNSGGDGLKLEAGADDNAVGFNRVFGSASTDIVDNGAGNEIAFNVTSDGSGTGYYVQSTTPSNPSTDDIWFDTT